MNGLRKIVTAAVAAAALSTGVFTTTPSFAYYYHWGYHWHYHTHYGWHHWGYHYFGYRPVVVGVAPLVCPPGTHLGSLGKHCWPNH